MGTSQKRQGRFLVRHGARVLAALGGLALMAIARAGAQGGGYREPEVRNIPYDGRFTFARIKYVTGLGGYYYRDLPAWAHGYPEAELNLMKIVNEVTLLRPHMDESNVLT